MKKYLLFYCYENIFYNIIKSKFKQTKETEKKRIKSAQTVG